MKKKNIFLVEFEGLKYGSHHFDWKIDESFFTDFGEMDFYNPAFDVQLELFRDSNMMVLKFTIEGQMQYDCDLCLNPLAYSFQKVHSMVVKFGEDEDADDDIIMLPKQAYEMDVKQTIFELLKISEPLKRNCDTAKIIDVCEKEAMQDYLAQQVTDEVEEKEEIPDDADPRWDALRKLKK